MANKDITPYTSAGDGDKILQKYLHLFQLSWKDARTYFDRAQEDMLQYEQDIDADTWPTLSEITLAEAKKFVDQILPVIMAQLFGSDNPFELIPAAKGIDFEKCRLVRDWILYNMLTYMKLETTGYLSIKEAVKLGVGYSIVEPKIITPPESNLLVAYANGEKIQTRVMEVGNPVMVPGNTYLPFGTVIPTPDGSCPEEVSCTFVLRMYPEDKFRKMLDKKFNPNTPFEGDVEKIINAARSKLFNGYLNTPRMIASQIANRSFSVTDTLNEPNAYNTPVIVPVLQCYAPDEQVFFACDQYRIYHVKNKYQTLRPPVIKATFDPDGEEWFTTGIIRPRRRMIMGVETFYNAIMDMITMHLHPHQFINRDALINEDDATGLQPYGKTMITGNMRAADVVTWATPPPLPQAILEIGGRLEEFDTASAGQPKSLHGQGTPGLVRGGSGAMESLMQSTSGRDKLTAKHFENGWYTSIVENTLILCQMLANEKEYLPKVEYNEAKRKSDLTFAEISRDDIRRVYQVQITFGDKMTNQLAEMTRNSMLYDRAMQNEHVNRREAFALLVGDTRKYNQLTAGVNKNENIQTMQAIAGKPPAAETGTPEGTVPPTTGMPPMVGGAGMAAGGLPR